ncbi:MAG TPA: glutamine-hydrolyzing GMP synthase [Solirubrobacterales bacterium]|nr:glutamine-hydrolyzing GMP synthase [Solirubrobacterales bacterium]
MIDPLSAAATDEACDGGGSGQPATEAAAREITGLEAASPETITVERPAATEEVLVLDFGGQYSQLIARRIRECGVYAELLPHDTDLERIRDRAPRALVLSGGPASVYAEGAPELRPELLDLGVPVLGICYGMQVMVQSLGGRVEAAPQGEFGRTGLTLVDEGGRLLAGLPAAQQCWMSHRDTVYEPPPGFAALASSPRSPVAACESPDRGLYGIQFHPEVVHTPHGTEILDRFLREISECRERWSPSSVIEQQVERVRAQVGEGGVICGLSGGVDSATAAALVHRAVGDQLTCVLVDHGLLRKDEATQVVEAFREGLGIPLLHVDASGRFLARLAGVTDPERKRMIIGEEFIRVFEEEAEKLSDARFLVQGTLYSDVIESGGGAGAATIKSHHNVGGLPDDLGLDLVEPLRMLFKDEVRAVASELDLPERIVWRQPFPGPGLAIRIVGGEVTRERLEILRDADAILQQEIRAAGLYRELWQSFCVLPVVRSVGVQGDERSYAYPIVIRAVTSDDAMTADWARLPYDLLERVSSRIIGEIRHVNRVTLDISSKPPATIEWE